MAHKVILPLAAFYSPFTAQPNLYNSSPTLCVKCKASVNCFASRDKQQKRWVCNFCGSVNTYLSETGSYKV